MTTGSPQHAELSGVRLPIGRSALLTSFIGRDAEIADVVELIVNGQRLVTLTGPGGVGKTRLALAIVAELEQTLLFTDGIEFVPLAPVADAALVIPTIARHLGVVAEDERAPVERLAAALQGRRMLLAIDNVEHVLGAALDLSQLLGACPELSLLTTSRRALHLVGEQEYLLPPLSVASGGARSGAAELAALPSVALFTARASAANPAFTLTDANAQAVATICARLDGLPLAIELAAARIKLMSPQALLARLSGRLQLLTSGPRDVPVRQQTLRDAIAWSYDLLRAEEQRHFRRMAVFAGGATLSAIEAVMPGDDSLDIAAALVDHSLLVQEIGADGESRLRMLETIREFALAQIELSGELDDARSAHATYFTTIAEAAAAPEYSRQEAALIRGLVPELDNIRAALTWLLIESDRGSDRARLGQRLAGAMVRFWDTQGYLAEEATWLQRALDAVPPEVTPERATLLTGMGVNAWFSGRHLDSVTWQEQALEIWRELGDQRAIVRSLWFLGLVAGKLGDIERLDALSAESAPLAPRIGVSLWQMVPGSLLGLAALARGDGAACRAQFGRTLDYHERHEFLWAHAWVLGILAEAALLDHDRPAALAFHQRSLAEFHEHGDLYATLDAIVAIAGHAAIYGQAPLAATLMGFVATARTSIGVRVTWQSGTEEETIEATRSALGAAAFEIAFDAGRDMALADAVAACLQVTPSEAHAPAPIVPDPSADAYGLSPRERQVLRLLSDGKSNDEIGEALFISPRTASTHVANILGKLGVNTRAAAVAVALKQGLV